jgi:hypothetical protein
MVYAPPHAPPPSPTVEDGVEDGILGREVDESDLPELGIGYNGLEEWQEIE